MAGIFRVAVEAIIVKESPSHKATKDQVKVLVMKRIDERDHAGGEWETLTGRVENGETFEKALEREVMEETGLK